MQAREGGVEEEGSSAAVGAEPAVASELERALGAAGRRVLEAAAFFGGAGLGELSLVAFVVLADERVALGLAPVVADVLIALPLVPDVIGLRGREAFRLAAR